MKWYHYSVEHFEDLRNVNHCEFLIMRRNDDSGKYILENNLRTWSELKKEHAQELVENKDKDEGVKENGKSKDVSTLARAAAVEVRRRWGGCPNGCDHDKSFKIRQTLADLVKSDSIISNHAVGLAVSEDGSSNGSNTTAVPNGNGAAAGSTCGITNPSFNGTANSQTLVSRRPAAKRFQSQTTDEMSDAPEFTVTGPQIDVTKARDEVVSSPDGTPSFISVEDRLRSRLKSPNMPPRPLEITQLHVGRDFGGTYSGHNSAGSDDADSDDDNNNGNHRRVNVITTPSPSSTTSTSSPITNGTGPTPGTTALGIPASAIPLHHRPHKHYHHHQREQSRMGRGTRANRLGDHNSSDGEHEADCEHEHGHGNGGDGVDEESGSELTREMADEADEVLAREEREDRSIQGSVY
jgi:hypothetical protein